VIRSLYSAASGMQAQQLNIDTVANNLSNVNTIGFKKGRAEFQELLYEQLRGPMESAPVGIQVGHGTRLSAIQRIFSGGSLTQTNTDFDLAIIGNGFFRLRRADGMEVYTRDGTFRLDGQGRLTNSNGLFVLGMEGPIRIEEPVEQVQIDADGRVSILDRETNEPVVVAQLNLAVFTNPAGLFSLGENLWAETPNSGEVQTGLPNEGLFGRIAQGYLEASNVETVEEMVNLIVAQRAYEISSKAVHSSDEMMAITNNLKR
jgi:flagellar basal-body rod protein FlgG